MHEIFAEFEENTTTYILLTGAFVCVVTFIGIIFLPIWILGFGQWFSRETVRRQVCQLTEKGLKVKKGIIFRTEKNIPLEKITDLTISQGPLQRYFGIYALKIETAGQSNPQGGGEGVLVGIKGAKDFRNHVLEYRDRISPTAHSDSLADAPVTQLDLLQEISSTLKNIERKLSREDWP